jgi:hypothetical protein
LTACAEPPVVSGDLSCVRFKRIHAGGPAVEIMKQHPAEFRPLAEQVAAHNEVYAKHCETSP